MSNLIRQKIIVAIDSLGSIKKENSKKFILFLPEFETHELSLLFANYLIRKSGHHTLYLGQNLPYTDLEAVLGHYDCEYILSVLTSTPSKLNTQALINNIAGRYMNRTILLTGYQIMHSKKILTPKNVKILEEISDLNVLLASL